MNSYLDIQALNKRIHEESAFTEDIRRETAKVVLGQQYMVDRLLLGLLTGGHILLEGLPGLAKTLAIKTLASTVNGKFSRVQFTPDLLPADIVGTMIYNPAKSEFTVRRGPIFANFVLADEINRAPAKVQSALLEAMQEKQVTIGDTSHRLQEPFLVLATQNPIEQEGTYPLPEAQTDRFMLKVKIGYPSKTEERDIMRQIVNQTQETVKQVATLDQLIQARETLRSVYMDEKVEKYIIDIVFATREPAQYGLPELKNLITYGGSPRASINLALASKAYAFLKRRGYVIPDDIRAICHDVLRHRIGLSYEAEAESITQEDIIDRIIAKIEVP